MSCFRKPNGVYPLCIGLSLLIEATGAVLALGPSQVELDQSAAAAENWLMTNKCYDGHRYVALDQINTKNVGDLRESCAYDSHVAALAQSAPVLYGRRIFLSIGQTTVAIDTASCKEIWRREWVLKDKALSTPNCGVAIKDGRVVRRTSDGFLIALNMDDGKLLWERQITSARESHYFSMPAMIVGDAIIYGTAEADIGGRGWIGAFSFEHDVDSISAGLDPAGQLASQRLIHLGQAVQGAHRCLHRSL